MNNFFNDKNTDTEDERTLENKLGAYNLIFLI